MMYDDFKKSIYGLKNSIKYKEYELEEKVRICTGVAVSILLCPDKDLRVDIREKVSKWIDNADLNNENKKLFKSFLVFTIQELIDLITGIDIEEHMKFLLCEDIIKVFDLKSLN